MHKKQIPRNYLFIIKTDNPIKTLDELTIPIDYKFLKDMSKKELNELLRNDLVNEVLHAKIKNADQVIAIRFTISADPRDMFPEHQFKQELHYSGYSVIRTIPLWMSEDTPKFKISTEAAKAIKKDIDSTKIQMHDQKMLDVQVQQMMSQNPMYHNIKRR
ncbi:hypothetical protein [Endozoicomonas sp. SCSIO W0465]|uniref:hypothetical protein n=1 Tax=Endozoicomonas sp. SCSIO W0465 TaxID=2918516 RepID=UPI002075713D|nr:hypothetical protein [Endozoicomonas sp. SCSIO W0465]USE39529.1 hypothetical protein MJO57_16005 [Endozoicomonas sp. SCSIO W0465]